MGMKGAAELCQCKYSKTCVKRPLSKRHDIGFQDQLSLNVDQKSCSMLQGEHSAIILSFIKLPFAIKIFVFIYEWPFYTGVNVSSENGKRAPCFIELFFASYES